MIKIIKFEIVKDFNYKVKGNLKRQLIGNIKINLN